MKVLDLFAGLEGWSEAWRANGHEVFSVDIDTNFSVDMHADIITLDPKDLPWAPDVILASPPCESFSLMSVGHHWNVNHTPKSETAVLGYKCVDATLSLVERLAPRWWVIENPRAKLRSMPFMKAVSRDTVWYCQYGMPYAKPTDLFGALPDSFHALTCHNGNSDHVASPRGSRTGIQSTSPHTLRRGSLALTKAASREYFGTSNTKLLAALRAKVPYQLSEAIMTACESDAG